MLNLVGDGNIGITAGGGEETKKTCYHGSSRTSSCRFGWSVKQKEKIYVSTKSEHWGDGRVCAIMITTYSACKLDARAIITCQVHNNSPYRRKTTYLPLVVMAGIRIWRTTKKEVSLVSALQLGSAGLQHGADLTFCGCFIYLHFLFSGTISMTTHPLVADICNTYILFCHSNADVRANKLLILSCWHPSFIFVRVK